MEPDTKCIRISFASLISFAADGNLQELSYCLKYGLDPSSRCNSVLRLAAHCGHLHIVAFLVQDTGINPSTCDNAPIRQAAKNGHWQVVEFLMQDHRVDPSTCDNEAIRLAAQYGHSKVVNLILKDSRVDPSARNNYALSHAALNGHLDIVDRLLKDQRVDPSAPSCYNALDYALSGGHFDIIYRLLDDARVEPSNGVLKLACRRGKIDLVHRLLEDGRCDTAGCLNVAIEAGYFEIVKLLCEKGWVDPSLDESSVICTAVRRGRIEICNYLLQDNRVDPCVSQALKCAAYYGNSVIVSRLLQLEEIDQSALHCALHDAAYHGNHQVVRCLLADPRVRECNEAFIKAIKYGYTNIVDLFLEDSRVDPSAVKICDLQVIHTALLQRLLADQRIRKIITKFSTFKPCTKRKKMVTLLAESSCSNQLGKSCTEISAAFVQFVLKNDAIQIGMDNDNVQAVDHWIGILWKRWESKIQLFQNIFLWKPDGPRARKLAQAWNKYFEQTKA
jgi:ankyrin repeat protein